MYKGVGPPLLSLSILNTINFASYSGFHTLLGRGKRKSWNVWNGIAGGLCGPIASVVSTVENLVKTQMQLTNVLSHQQHTQRYRNSLQCLQYILANHGVSGVYTGHVVNTAREAAFLSTYFFVYEGLRYQFHSQQQSRMGQSPANYSRWSIPVAGGLAGSIAWTVSFPLDCIRARVQGQGDLSYSSRSSYRLIVQQLLAEKGIVGLYVDVGPSILRPFVVSGSRFSAYETVVGLLRHEGM